MGTPAKSLEDSLADLKSKVLAFDKKLAKIEVTLEKIIAKLGDNADTK